MHLAFVESFLWPTTCIPFDQLSITHFEIESKVKKGCRRCCYPARRFRLHFLSHPACCRSAIALSTHFLESLIKKQELPLNTFHHEQQYTFDPPFSQHPDSGRIYFRARGVKRNKVGFVSIRQ